MNRVVGLETEYGCLAADVPGAPSVIAQVRNWIFQDQRHGLVDIHQRDWDEPAGNGGFLYNGARVYVDMGHLEYCTPECRQLRDLILHDRAGDVILTRALSDLGLSDHAGFIRNNIDHYAGSTFGCHENYLVRKTALFTERHLLSLLAFLTLRILFTGAGRVGEAPGGRGARETMDSETPIAFQISQRADYVHNDLFEWVQFNRAIINTRDEPLADPALYRRLHLLHGDTSVLPETLALKAGTTSLVLDLLEIGALPEIAIEDAAGTYKELSRRPDGPWLVGLLHGGEADALELLGIFWDQARTYFCGRDAETDWILNRWKASLEALADKPDALIGRVDWITKKWLFDQFVSREGTSWSDPWLKAQDLEFHHADPSKSLGLAAAAPDGIACVHESELEVALATPPADTRAALRGRALAALHEGKHPRYFIDWEGVEALGSPLLQLMDPFDCSVDRVADWSRLLASGGAQGVAQALDDAS